MGWNSDNGGDGNGCSRGEDDGDEGRIVVVAFNIGDLYCKIVVRNKLGRHAKSHKIAIVRLCTDFEIVQTVCG